LLQKVKGYINALVFTCRNTSAFVGLSSVGFFYFVEETSNPVSALIRFVQKHI
jgi:hypothetical protein